MHVGVLLKWGRKIRSVMCEVGVRFSTKAFMPSFWSALANSEWNSRRSKRTPFVEAQLEGAVDALLGHHRGRQ